MVADDDRIDAPSMRHKGRELLLRIKEGFDSLMAAVHPLDEQAMTAVASDEQWSVKEHLAHIAAWEEILLRFHIGGEPFESAVGMQGASYRVTSYDVINEHLHHRDSGLTARDVITKLKLGHEAVMRAVAGLTDEELAEPRPWLDTPEGPSGPLSQYIAWNTYEHYAEHLATIESL